MEKSSILWFKILFLDTTENAPLTLQGIIFILSRLNIFYPSFSQKKKKKRSGRERDGKQNAFCFLGEPRSCLTTSGEAHTRLGMFCRWSHNRLKPKKARLASCLQKQGQDSCFDLILSKPAAKAGCSVINQQRLCDTISSSLLWVRLDAPSFGTITKP